MTLLVVSVQSAPTMTLENRRLSSPPKWVNPCGLAAEDFNGDLDVVQLTDSQLLHQVVVQAKTALMHAELFREDYVSTPDSPSFPPRESPSSFHRAPEKQIYFQRAGEIFRAIHLRAISTKTNIKFINGSIITDVTSGGDRTGKGDIERKAVMVVLPVVRTLIVESQRPSKEISNLRMVYRSRLKTRF